MQAATARVSFSYTNNNFEQIAEYEEKTLHSKKIDLFDFLTHFHQFRLSSCELRRRTRSRKNFSAKA